MIKRHHIFFLFLTSFWFLLFCAVTSAQKVFRLDSVNEEIVLNKDWKIHKGDNKEWANPAFDDKDWDTISRHFVSTSTDSIKPLYILSTNNGIVWLRLHLKVAPTLLNKTLLLQVNQSGASEIYLNGRLIESFGRVGTSETEIPYNPNNNVYHIQLGSDTIQVLALRYSQNSLLKGDNPNHSIVIGVTITLANLSKINDLVLHDELIQEFCIFVFAVFLTLSLFHLLLFGYYRKTHSNLYYSIFAAFMAVLSLSIYLIVKSHNPLWVITIAKVDGILVALCFFMILVLLYSIFEKKINWLFWTLIGLTVLSIITSIMNLAFTAGVLVFTQASTASFSGIVIIIKALRKKQKGVWIIATGFLVFLGLIPWLLILMAINSIFKQNIGSGLGPHEIVFFIWIFSIPSSMSAYLASDFARTNKKLSLQLTHVKQLSEQNIQKEVEKKQIIEQQKEILEIQVKEKTFEIQEQKNELVQKNTEIIDSILYARRIQTAILPTDEMLKDALGDYLVIFQPKDVVSGDFYWCHVNGDIVVFAVADCTGHGVPGALMSMICNSLLNEVVTDGKAFEADLILNELRRKLIGTLQQSGGNTTRDGMDIALCVLNKKDNTLQYAGANNPLYIISENIALNANIEKSVKIRPHNSHLLEIAADKQPIGYQEGKMDNPFTRHVIQLRKGDIIYITSDGYIDQFGGNRNKKFTSKRLRDMLETFVGQPIDTQRISLVQTIENWRNKEIQTDDICIFGVKI